VIDRLALDSGRSEIAVAVDDLSATQNDPSGAPLGP